MDTNSNEPTSSKSIDELTQARFDAYMKLSESMGETDEEFMARRSEMEQAGRNLEERFADRGLVFTRDFSGAMPVQAFGVIDGMRFYFRFRHNTATLNVGELDPEKPQRDYERQVKQIQDAKDALEQKLAKGEADDDFVLRINAARVPAKETPNGIDDYPTLLSKRAVIADVTDSPHAGILSGNEAEDLFTELVAELEDVDINLNPPGGFA